jgi:hypothetical protein
MPDLSFLPDSPELEDAFLAVVDREGKIPSALEDLGPIAGRDVVVLDAGRGHMARRLEELGGRVTVVPFDDPTAAERVLPALPEAAADVVIALWSEAATPGSAFLAAAERLLRPDGKLLLVHDYGRDDVWGLWPERRERVVAWSQRRGPFLGDGFRIRVIHCRWTFESIQQADGLLRAAFGERGGELVATMKPDRPRLEYQVAIYHRWPAEVARLAASRGGEPADGANPPGVDAGGA